MSAVIHILRVPTYVHSRKPDGEPRWCFTCRKRVPFTRTVHTPVNRTSYYGSHCTVECEHGHADGDCFPGRCREWFDRLDAALAERDEMEARWQYAQQTRAEAMALWKAAEKERDRAISLLRLVVQADNDDAKMGHPNPGDSCVSVILGLHVYEYLARQGGRP